MYKALCKFNKNIVNIEEKFLMILLGVITVVMTLQVVMRFVFQSPLTWSQEVTLFLLVYLCYFSADVVFYKNSHIQVDFFVDKMSIKWKKITNIFVNVIICVVLLFIFRYSVSAVIKQMNHTIGGVLQIRKSFWILPLTITFPLMVIKSIEKIMANFAVNESEKETEVI